MRSIMALDPGARETRYRWVRAAVASAGTSAAAAETEHAPTASRRSAGARRPAPGANAPRTPEGPAQGATARPPPGRGSPIRSRRQGEGWAIAVFNRRTRQRGPPSDLGRDAVERGPIGGGDGQPQLLQPLLAFPDQPQVRTGRNVGPRIFDGCQSGGPTHLVLGDVQCACQVTGEPLTDEAHAAGGGQALDELRRHHPA